MGDLEDSGESLAKRNRSEIRVQDPVGRQLLELREKFANINKASFSWSSQQAPAVPYLPDDYGWGPHKVLNSTSAPSSVDSPSFPVSTDVAPVKTSDDLERETKQSPSHWKLPSRFPRLGIRVDARDYALKERAEAEKREAGSREKLEKMIKEVENHACPPCEHCDKCWLL